VGLDLVVQGCAREGHELEWRQILERSFRGQAKETDATRFTEISTPPYERVDAPRVGFDPAADDWMIKASGAGTPEHIATVLKQYHGYYVLRLVQSDGVPKYSHGGLYDGVDETSFRGAFLSDCRGVLPTELIEQAWGHKFPEETISYGRALLDAAEIAESRSEPSSPERGVFSIFASKKREPSQIPVEEQLDIVRSAGRWLIFWGERGHAIRAWF
jgi:hypothetical protein